MSKKVETSSPEGNYKEDSEADFHIEFEDFTAQIMKQDLAQSIHDERSPFDPEEKLKERRDSRLVTELYETGTKSEKKMALLK